MMAGDGTGTWARHDDAGSAEPLLSTRVRDRDNALTGWVVVDSLVDGMAMGGTRMTAGVTEPEVCDLARAMTVKLALVGLPIGGAKAGIVAVPRQRLQVLRAFGRTVAPLLHGGVYLGCDQGTTHADRDLFFAEAGYDVLSRPKVTRPPVDWAVLWRHTADVTGFGVAEATLTALPRHTGGGARLVVQGFGTVGRAAARHLVRNGLRLVAVADVTGTVRSDRGLPVDELIGITDAAGTIDRTRLPAGVRACPEPDAWLGVDADVLVLAAAGGALREDNAHLVRAGLVVEAGNLCCTPAAKRILAAAGVLVLPDVVVNVGAAGVTGCILTGLAPSGVPLAQFVTWLFDWVRDRIHGNVRDVLDITAAGGDPVSQLLAARRAGSSR